MTLNFNIIKDIVILLIVIIIGYIIYMIYNDILYNRREIDNLKETLKELLDVDNSSNLADELDDDFDEQLDNELDGIKFEHNDNMAPFVEFDDNEDVENEIDENGKSDENNNSSQPEGQLLLNNFVNNCDYDYGVDTVDKVDTNEISSCEAFIKSGKRKGQRCGISIVGDAKYCSKHQL